MRPVCENRISGFREQAVQRVDEYLLAKVIHGGRTGRETPKQVFIVLSDQREMGEIIRLEANQNQPRLGSGDGDRGKGLAAVVQGEHAVTWDIDLIWLGPNRTVGIDHEDIRPAGFNALIVTDCQANPAEEGIAAFAYAQNGQPAIEQLISLVAILVAPILILAGIRANHDCPERAEVGGQDDVLRHERNLVVIALQQRLKIPRCRSFRSVDVGDLTGGAGGLRSCGLGSGCLIGPSLSGGRRGLCCSVSSLSCLGGGGGGGCRDCPGLCSRCGVRSRLGSLLSGGGLG
jgi:hypothetical protein